MSQEFNLADRLNWRQACTLLGISKSKLYRMIKEEKIIAQRVGERGLWVSRQECERRLIEGQLTDNIG